MADHTTLDHSMPDIVPLLGRGRHRTMSKGACFMEMASYLAGERWSDHPPCTHPLLAELARDVNDSVSDRTRQRLAPMIPDVVGVRPVDPRVDPWLARLCALAALPVSAAETQRALAVGLLRSEALLAQLESRPYGEHSPQTRAVLDTVPHAATWARQMIEQVLPGSGTPGTATNLRGFTRRSAPTIVVISVRGIAAACISDPETRLVALLRDAITLCRTASTAARPAPSLARVS